MRRYLLPLACLVAAPAAVSADRPAGQAGLDHALTGFTPGEPLKCFDRTRAASLEGHGATILYRVSPQRIYRNDTTGNCRGLARGDIVVTRSTSGRLCAGDLVTTVNPVSRAPSGSCSLGAFVPYRR